MLRLVGIKERRNNVKVLKTKENTNQDAILDHFQLNKYHLFDYYMYFDWVSKVIVIAGIVMPTYKIDLIK